MSTQENMGEVNEDPETLNEYSKINWNNIPLSSSDSCTSGHYPTSDPVKAPGSDGITFSVQTTNPLSNSGCITKTLKPGGKLSHKITLQPNDNGGQSSKPSPKEKKRKYDREGSPLLDKKEEAKRQKAIASALWREKNIGICKENTTVEINIERSLSTSDPVQRSEGVQMVLEERKNKTLLLEGFKNYVNKIEQELKLQIELENQKEKEGLTHKLEQSELENKKEKEGLTHKLEQSELENKKLKEENKDLMKKQLEWYSVSYNLKHLQTYYKQE